MKNIGSDRNYWVKTMCKIIDPVLVALAEKRLKVTMPVERMDDERVDYAYLEALGRTLTGIAPWLESKPVNAEEDGLRRHYADLARRAIDAGTDPDSPDYMNFSTGFQPIVDAAFLAHAIVRAPTELWQKLSQRVQTNVIHAFKLTRSRKPRFKNWLLFSAMIETALLRMGETDWDPMRIDFALKQHEQWYLGDGTYGDGPHVHVDYYNSFVIHPMLIDIIENVWEHAPDWAPLKEPIRIRAKRYATLQERSISPEGTFPVWGRSITYRFGAFQLLAQIALRGELSSEMTPSQVRCALTAVIRRMIDMEGIFDENGWLQIGFCGHQPELAEHYITTGSLYLCTAVFLPLGLTEDDPFWQGTDQPWTSKKAWSGQTVKIDKYMV